MSSSSLSLLYPPSPKNVDPRITEPSKEFRREVVKVLWSIVSFMLIYLTLVILAVILALLCGYGGITLIIAFPKFLTLILGTGLAGVGIMVLYFLFKFVFSSHKVDRANLIEIKHQDHPLLFEFIRKVADETQTPMPKHVFISPEVNACVFYDSGFWSMFLPIRKNLQIGLGLVNSLNLSEFKAVIAHEFGHFSQRSMKLGSYVYNVNKVIYNMLYDNQGYGDSLQAWANISNYFYFFAQITSGIVSGIQSVLKLQYARINKGYMALSRQMEFHADSVAASVSGSLPLITSLRRFEVSDSCYTRVLNHYNAWYKDHNRKALNIYQDHTTVMLHFGATHGLPIEQGTLQVTDDVFTGIPECRVIIKDQWASHPGTDEREQHLKRLNVSSELNSTPAWCLFQNPEVLQNQLTNHLYSTLDFKNEPVVIEPSEFSKLFYEESEKYSLDPAYKGYYDDRIIKAFDLEITGSDKVTLTSFDEVLTSETLKLPLCIKGMQREIELLNVICLKTSGIETFEFNHEKYTCEQASAVLQQVHRESDQAKADLLAADRRLFLLYHRFASQQATTWRRPAHT